MKMMLAGCAVLAAVASTLAQGTLQFGNDLRNDLGVPVFRAPIYACDPADPTSQKSGQSGLGLPVGTTVYGGPLLQGTGYTMALFAGPTGAVDPNSLVLVASATFRTAAGNMLPAGLVITTTVPIGGVAAGQTATLQIRVWDNQGGSISSWAQVLASSTPRGATPLFNSPPLGDATNPALSSPLMTGWTSFQLVCVPEPSAIALGILAFGLWFARRPGR
jgi:hypothetical protein